MKKTMPYLLRGTIGLAIALLFYIIAFFTLNVLGYERESKTFLIAAIIGFAPTVLYWIAASGGQVRKSEWIVGCAVGLGLLGLLGGTLGPLLLAPEANQGPLLGIFFTGPGGLVVGALLSQWIYNSKIKVE